MEAELLDCLTRLQSAVAAHQDTEDLLELDSVFVHESANRVLAARLELYACLVRTGWAPPETIRLQMQADAALLQLP